MSGKATPTTGNHGPAIIEGPATAHAWLTVFPAPPGSATTFDRTTGRRTMAALPTVGITFSLVTMVLVLALQALLVPSSFIAIACVLCWQLLTRMLHLDGLADVGDALGSYAPPEQAQKILADKYTGALGMGTVLLTLLAQIGALNALLTQLAPLNAATIVTATPLIARTAALIPCHRRWTPMSNTGFGSMVIGTLNTTTIVVWTFTVAMGIGVLGTLTYQPPATVAYNMLPVIALLVTLGMAALSALALSRHFHKRFHGLNGDCIGAIIELTTAIAPTAYLITISAVAAYTQ